MVGICQDIFVLQKAIAVGVLVLLIIVSFFSIKSVVKIVVSFIALFVAIAHYAVLSSLTKYVKVMIYPFIVTESTSSGSVFYVDIGQLILVLLLLAWRAELHDLLRKTRWWRRHERVERNN
ncbi:MAG: hypothetical protein QXH02_07865 [Desulfurococcaceae archaeon]